MVFVSARKDVIPQLAEELKSAIRELIFNLPKRFGREIREHHTQEIS